MRKVAAVRKCIIITKFSSQAFHHPHVREGVVSSNPNKAYIGTLQPYQDLHELKQNSAIIKVALIAFSQSMIFSGRVSNSSLGSPLIPDF